MKPRFIPHQSDSEPGCITCKNYVNMVDNWRQYHLNKIIIPDKLPKIKRLFDLPSPYLVKN